MLPRQPHTLYKVSNRLTSCFLPVFFLQIFLLERFQSSRKIPSYICLLSCVQILFVASSIFNPFYPIVYIYRERACVFCVTMTLTEETPTQSLLKFVTGHMQSSQHSGTVKVPDFQDLFAIIRWNKRKNTDRISDLMTPSSKTSESVECAQMI